jgi:hypothetical protein
MRPTRRRCFDAMWVAPAGAASSPLESAIGRAHVRLLERVPTMLMTHAVGVTETLSLRESQFGASLGETPHACGTDCESFTPAQGASCGRVSGLVRGRASTR